MRFLVFGAGAIGTYIGGSLAWQGHEVTFLERSDGASELLERGMELDLRLASLTEPLRLSPPQFQAVDSLEAALAGGRFDLAIFALKSFDTPAVARLLRPLAQDLPPLLCLSNGVENEALLAEALGTEKIIAGTVTSAVARQAIGQIRLEKLRGVGIAATHPLSAAIFDAFHQAGLRPRLYPQPAAMKWSKLLTNLVANATAAILDMSPAEIFSHPGLYRLEMAQLREALAVMRAQGLPVIDLPGTPVRWLARLAQAPAYLRPIAKSFLAKGRGGKMPSLHIDLYGRRGRSEVEYLHGAVVRFGARYGLPTPVNRLLTETLLALTRGDLPVDTFAHQPQKLLQALSSDTLK